MVCVIIVAIGLSLAKESILKVIHPSEVDCNVLMIVVMSDFHCCEIMDEYF